MNLQQILARMAEINLRMSAIQTEVNNPETTSVRMTELNGEVDSLVEERSDLTRQSISIRATARDLQPVVNAPSVVEREDSVYATPEYRRAFMNWVLRQEDNEILHRADVSTQKTNITTVIVPAVITDKLFESNALAGSIFARVSKTNYKPGMSVKTSNFTPVLAWVSENAKSDRQGASTGEISFSGYKGEIRVAISLEATEMSLEAFESKLNTKILEGCSLGFDKSIVAGSGTGQPKGILTAGTYTGASGVNAYTLDNKSVSDYSKWVELFAKIPQSKKSKSVLHINAVDWYSKIFGMKDTNGRVVALDTVGFGGTMTPTFMGRPVVLMEDQGLATFDEITGSATKSKSTVFSYFFDDEAYCFNSNMQLRLKEYVDEDTDEIIHKATIIADGKPVDTKGLIIVCRGADAV